MDDYQGNLEPADESPRRMVTTSFVISPELLELVDKAASSARPRWTRSYFLRRAAVEQLERLGFVVPQELQE